MPRLLLAGAPTGCWTNLGDEAILAGMVGALREAIDDVQFTVITSSPPETYAPYGCESVRFDDLPGLAAAVAASDAVVLGGGSIFFDYWGCDSTAVLTRRHQGVSLWTGLALLAAADGIPVVTYDVGVGPLNTPDGELMSRAAFELAAAVTVRDTGSAGMAGGWGRSGVGLTGVRLTGDPAIRVELPATEQRQAGPLLGVSLREWETGVDPEAWNRALATIVDAHLERTGGRAVFVACHRAVRWPLTDDGGAAAAVISMMAHGDRVTVVAAETPWQDRAAVLAGCDAVLAMRYHAALFAMRAGVPTVGLSYDAKVASLFADWGVADRCLQLAEAAAHPDRVVALLADGPADGALAAGRERMLARESETAHVVAGVLTGEVEAGGLQPSLTHVHDLLERMATNADERPEVFTAALERLGARIGARRRPTVAILTNRLLDRATGEVQIGGAERYALDLARLLRDLGLEPAFYQGGGEFEVGDFYGFPVHPIPFGEAISEFQVGIAAEFHRRTADADHVLYLMPNYATGPMRSDAVVISHGVWWDHDLWPHLQFRSPEWLEQLERVFTSPCRVISVDTNTANVVRALFPAAAQNIRHVPSAVDTTVFAPPDYRPERDPVVMFPRRAETIRGSHLVGPILDLVPDPCRFVWVGGGGREQMTQLRAVAKRDARLTLTEAAFDEMPKHYAEADICVIPSVGSEGQSLSCLEAMASGAAVVVTTVGGLPELVTDGVDGLVCDPTPESLAAAIRRLVRDPALRDRLGSAARRTALRHSSQRWRLAWTEQLRELGWVDAPAAARAVPYDVITFPIINWEVRYQRPQQVATHWARHGRRVFYVRLDGHLPPGGPPFSVQRLTEGVYEVRLALPAGLNLHHGKLPEGLLPAAVSALRALRKEWHIDAAVSLVELGTWQPVAAALRDEFGWPVHYDCMDNWSTFPGFSSRPNVLAMERELVRTADSMTVSARSIQQHWSAERPDAVLIRNAADFEFFHGTASTDGAASAEPPAPLAGITGPIAGFIGAVVEWFDVELVRQVALARPDVSFVFVGGVTRVSVEPLSGLPNVHFLGHQPYEDMPRYLRHFDVGIVPFTVDPTTASMDLVKIYEYFAQGKAVVCTPVAEMVRYSHYLYLADGAEAFVAQLDRALAEDDEAAVQRRITFARLNSWDDRIEVLEQLANDALVGGGNTRAVDGDVAGLVAAAGSRAAAREVAKAQADLAAVQRRLDELRRSRAMRIARKLWAIRRAVSRGSR